MPEPEHKEDVDTTKRRPLISRDTVIPLSAAAVLVSIVASVSWAFGSAYMKANYDQIITNKELRDELKNVKDGLASIQDRMTSDSSRYVTRDEMTTFVELLFAKNPTIVLPGVFTRKK